jgi:hypothetical protein
VRNFGRQVASRDAPGVDRSPSSAARTMLRLIATATMAEITSASTPSSQQRRHRLVEGGVRALVGGLGMRFLPRHQLREHVHHVLEAVSAFCICMAPMLTSTVLRSMAFSMLFAVLRQPPRQVLQQLAVFVLQRQPPRVSSVAAMPSIFFFCSAVVRSTCSGFRFWTQVNRR